MNKHNEALESRSNKNINERRFKNSLKRITNALVTALEKARQEKKEREEQHQRAEINRKYAAREKEIKALEEEIEAATRRLSLPDFIFPACR